MPLLGFLGRSAKASSGDVEGGIHRPSLAVPFDGAAPRMSAETTLTKTDPMSPLAQFRLLVGITSSSDVHSRINTKSSAGAKRAAPNIGIYSHVVHYEQNSKKGFKTYSILINTCLGLQIIVAAALTAMGAGNINHATITVFGAINTVIAGFLTFLKGSGLPNRLKYYCNEWKHLREYIEQRERALISATGALTLEEVHKVVHTIEQMYDEIKSDINANTPDAYVSAGKLRQRFQQVETPGFKFTEQLPAHKAPAVDMHDLDEKAHDISASVRDRGVSFAAGTRESATGIGSRAEQLKGQLTHLQEGLGGKLGTHAQQFVEKARETVEDLAKHEKEAEMHVEQLTLEHASAPEISGQWHAEKRTQDGGKPT